MAEEIITAEAAPEPGSQAEVDSLLAELDGETAPPQEPKEPAAVTAKPAEKPAEEPGVAPGPEPTDAAVKAHEAFKARRANAAQLRQQLEQAEAGRRAQEDFVNRVFAEAAKLAKPEAKPEEKPAKEPALADDPEKWAAWVQSENRRMAEEVKALREGQEQREREAQEQQQRWEQQQQAMAQEAATMRADIETWDSEVGGFLSRQNPATGEVEKGIYDEWSEAVDYRGQKLGMQPHEIQAEKDRRLRSFWELGSRTGMHPCNYLEDDAAQLGVRAEVPAQPQPQPQPAQPQRPSPASQTLAAAKAAQADGVAGSIGNGAQSPGGSAMPTTIEELMAAGVDAKDVAMSFFKHGREDDGLDRLLELDMKSGTTFRTRGS